MQVLDSRGTFIFCGYDEDNQEFELCMPEPRECQPQRPATTPLPLVFTYGFYISPACAPVEETHACVCMRTEPEVEGEGEAPEGE
jgi:hypothetical protein